MNVHFLLILFLDTSRPKRADEVDGQDYHFISRLQFEQDIVARKFVEHGEYEKAYYGTSLESIRNVVYSKKICVLNLHPQCLKMLKSSTLMPYVVFVAPPNLEKLRNIITTYVWDNLDVGYMQGMCDIVAPLLVVFNDEAITHSCFAYLMERMLW